MRPSGWIVATLTFAIGLSICALTAFDVCRVINGEQTISGEVKEICGSSPLAMAFVMAFLAQLFGLAEGAIFAHLFWPT